MNHLYKRGDCECEEREEVTNINEAIQVKKRYDKKKARQEH